MIFPIWLYSKIAKLLYLISDLLLTHVSEIMSQPEHISNFQVVYDEQAYIVWEGNI